MSLTNCRSVPSPSNWTSMVALSGPGQGGVAERVGLPDDLREVVERAAKLHDIGKADERFQRWLDSRRESGLPLAKSNVPRHRWEAMRVSSGWPRGGRHEDLSARLVRAWLALTPGWGTPLQRDLLVHLVISHHGKGSPAGAAGSRRIQRFCGRSRGGRIDSGGRGPFHRRLGAAMSIPAVAGPARALGTGIAGVRRHPAPTMPFQQASTGHRGTPDACAHLSGSARFVGQCLARGYRCDRAGLPHSTALDRRGCARGRAVIGRDRSGCGVGRIVAG